MPRRKKKPHYDPENYMESLLKEMAEIYGTYDDREEEGEHVPSLNAIAEEFEINPLKARKLLITAGVYSTAISRKIAEYVAEGKTQSEIMELMNLSRASVNSYLPYKDVIYKMPERSVDADRSQKYRLRTRSVGDLLGHIGQDDTDADDEMQLLWNCVKVFEGYKFETPMGRSFKYAVRQNGDSDADGEIVFGLRGREWLTRANVEQAYERVLSARQEQGTTVPVIKSPERLDVQGSTYLYPMFIRFGVVAAGK